MKSWATTAITIIIGVVLGWLITLFGLSQPWWPLSVSGQPEVVVSGQLLTTASGSTTGLEIQSADQKTFVDLSRLSSTATSKKLNRNVTARGQIVQSFSGDFLLVSYLK